jgi:hypothetical protein
MTELEERFDRYFATQAENEPLHSVRILDLTAAQSQEVRELSRTFIDIRTEINQRFAINAQNIVAPEGHIQIHMDYIASSEVNALAFYFEG